MAMQRAVDVSYLELNVLPSNSSEEGVISSLLMVAFPLSSPTNQNIADPFRVKLGIGCVFAGDGESQVMRCEVRLPDWAATRFGNLPRELRAGFLHLQKSSYL
jgi:hypothetical protein